MAKSEAPTLTNNNPPSNFVMRSSNKNPIKVHFLAPPLTNEGQPPEQPLKAPKVEEISPCPSPPLLSPVNVKPEYLLVPIRTSLPTYGLVYQGPAPKGWEQNPEWHRNVFSTNEMICYKDDYFYFRG